MKADRFKFRLYIAGDASNSVAARTNLHAICAKHLPGRYDIEIVDVYTVPDRALDEGIFLTPTLVKLFPPPIRQIVGSLADEESVLHTIGVTPENK